MAVTQNTLIGRARGSIGGVTFSKWKGLNVAKSKPVTVANPNTYKQRVSRLRLSIIVGLFRAAAAAIVAGFRERAVNKSEYNAFTSANATEFTDFDENLQPTYNYERLKVSQGSVGQIATLEVTQEGEDSIRINWDNAEIPVGGAPGDDLYFVAIDTDSNTVIYADKVGVKREVGTALVTPAAGLAGGAKATYTFFVSNNQDKSSDSQYFGLL